MKLRDLSRALGLTSPPREYPTRETVWHLAQEGDVRFAQWEHPGETPKAMTQSSVDQLRRFLRPGDVALDIGAHTGDSTVPMALAVGAAGTVFALEPNPYVFKVLALNSTLNPRAGRIVPLMFAAMPEDGEFEFQYTDEGYCNGGFHGTISRWRHGHFVTLRVKGRNVWHYLQAHAPEALARLRYIKIDTEGFDRAVAATLREALATRRPYVKSEIYKHLPAGERHAYYGELRDLGYRLFKCEEDASPGAALSRADMTRWRHFDFLAVPDERV